MSNIHIWAGLLAGWILYAMFLTGTVSFFRDEITQYMQPELQTSDMAALSAGHLAQNLISKIRQSAPDSTQISLTLPTHRNPHAWAFWNGAPKEGADSTQPQHSFDSARFDTQTLERIQARPTQGGDFFFRFHFDFHYIPAIWGRWLAGICAMFMLVAIISGVITHKKIFTDFFTFRPGKGQRSWLDAHNALSVLGLPFHFMITWSGLVTLMVLYFPWSSHFASNSNTDFIGEFQSEVSSFFTPAAPSASTNPLTPIAPLVAQAQAKWGPSSVSRVDIHNPGNQAARIYIVRGENTRVAYTPYYMEFDGSSGALLQEKTQVSTAGQVRGVLHGLHLGRFADTVTRWLYFLVSLAGTAMVGTGLVMWTVKRRAKLAQPHRPYFGFWLVERLNIASIAGLSVSMIGFFWLNRLLPVEMPARAEMEINGFFLIWATALAYAFVRPARKAWVELLTLAACLCITLPLLNMAMQPSNLIQSLQQGRWLFVYFEWALFAFGALHAYLAWRTHKAAHTIKQRVPAQSNHPTHKGFNTPEESAKHIPSDKDEAP